MAAAAPVTRLKTRAAMLYAGREIVLRAGFGALTVREVTTAADANVGSFVYHFGSRDAFVRELIEQWYAPLFDRVRTVAGRAGSGIDLLRSAIQQLLEFGGQEAQFLGRLAMGAANGEAAAREFLSTLAGRHPRVLLALVRAAQAEGSLVDEDPLQVLMFLMASVGLPRLIAAAWDGPPVFNKSLSASLGRIACDPERILQRLEWAISGLTPRGLP
jgi:TetR/AcrR family transcriptional repressor of nem operon